MAASRGARGSTTWRAVLVLAGWAVLGAGVGAVRARPGALGRLADRSGALIGYSERVGGAGGPHRPAGGGVSVRPQGHAGRRRPELRLKDPPVQPAGPRRGPRTRLGPRHGRGRRCAAAAGRWG